MATAPVHALLEDLFFRSRIEATAEAAGVRLIVSRTLLELIDRIEEAGGAGVLVDLSLGPTACEAIAALKRRAESPTVVAWGSHVDAEALEAARAAGADRVLARSAFTRRLPDLLRELAADVS